MNQGQQNYLVVVVGDRGHHYVAKDGESGALSVVNTFSLASPMTAKEASVARRINPRAVVIGEDEYRARLQSKLAMLGEACKSLPADVGAKFVRLPEDDLDEAE